MSDAHTSDLPPPPPPLPHPDAQMRLGKTHQCLVSKWQDGETHVGLLHVNISFSCSSSSFGPSRHRGDLLRQAGCVAISSSSYKEAEAKTTWVKSHGSLSSRSPHLLSLILRFRSTHLLPCTYSSRRVGSRAQKQGSFSTRARTLQVCSRVMVE